MSDDPAARRALLADSGRSGASAVTDGRSNLLIARYCVQRALHVYRDATLSS